MTKPNPNDPSTYRVRCEERVEIMVVSYGVPPLVKASLDGKPLPGPPFVFTVTQPSGGLHIVVMEFDFPPESSADARHEVSVRGSHGGDFYVTTIRPDTPIKTITLKFEVV